MIRILVLVFYISLSLVQQLVIASVPLAFNGFDPISCSTGHIENCKVANSSTWSTEYSSLDKDGSPRFTSEFWFISEDNMVSFENSPYVFAPRVGGFCAYTLATLNSSSPWSEKFLGPDVDLVSSWRNIPMESGLNGTYLFANEQYADAFITGLPDTQAAAEKVWSNWFGDHGSVPPYAVAGGPFNSVCFNAGAKTRDCASNPQPLPSLN